MAVDLAPASWIASWSEDGTDVTFPIASLPELTAAEADGTTGDIRKVMFALLEHLWTEWAALPAEDRPVQMTLTKSVSQNTTSGILQNTYSFRFNNEIAEQDVAPEPS